MNKVILRGNVGKDAEIHVFDNGGKVAKFTLATTERGFKTKDGKEVPETTDWHNIVVKASGLAGVCEKYVKKGTPVLVVGKVHYREYEGNDGQKKYTTEIIVDEIELLGAKKSETEAAKVDDDMPF